MSDEIDIERFNKIVQEYERLRREWDRLDGALDQYLETLQREYDCGTLDAGTAKLAALERRCSILGDDYHKHLEFIERNLDSRRSVDHS